MKILDPITEFDEAMAWVEGMLTHPFSPYSSQEIADLSSNPRGLFKDTPDLQP